MWWDPAQTKIAADKLSFREKASSSSRNEPARQTGDIDHMLNIFDGREDRLAVMLQKKYGESLYWNPEKTTSRSTATTRTPPAMGVARAEILMTSGPQRRW